MKIYTRTGDGGDTIRPGQRRVRKDDPLVAAGGDVDELNAHVGLCLQQALSVGAGPVADALSPIQPELMVIGSLLAMGETGTPPAVRLDDSAVARMERQMDCADEVLAELSSFILPRGSALACELHVARTVCRRAERTMVAAIDAGCDVPAVVIRYLNRLSDLLFTLARLANHVQGVREEPWRR